MVNKKYLLGTIHAKERENTLLARGESHERVQNKRPLQLRAQQYQSWWRHLCDMLDGDFLSNDALCELQRSYSLTIEID